MKLATPWIFACLATVPAWGGEYAVLTTGARLYADRHEQDGGKVTLFTASGSTQIDAAMVAGFEQEESVPAVAPPVAPAVPAPVPAGKTLSLNEMIDNAARKYGLPPSLVRAVVAVESGYQPDAVSPKGAIGLMQLMPATAKQLGVDPTIAEQNVDAGTRYLRDLLVKYDNHAYHALAAYNAGPGAVDKYHGVPPYRETHDYILSVLKKWQKQQTAD